MVKKWNFPHKLKAIAKGRSLYQHRLIRTLVVLVTCALVFTTISLYIVAHSSALDMQQEAYVQEREQFNAQLTFMGDTLKNLIMSLYVDPEVYTLMHGEELSIIEIASKMRKVEQIANATGYLESIAIYNGPSEQLFSTSAVIQQNARGERDVVLQQLTLSDPASFKLMPFSVPNAPGTAEQVDSLLYGLFDFSVAYRNTTHPEPGSILLFIRPSWLFQQLSVNSGPFSKSSQFFVGTPDGIVFDQDGRRLDRDRKGLRHGTDEAFALAYEDVHHNPGQSGSFVHSSDQGKMVIRYAPTEFYGWTLYQMQPYRQIVARMDRLAFTFVAVGGGTLLASVVISYLFALKLYRPLSRLVQQWNLSPRGGLHTHTQDEFSWLQQMYRGMMSRLEHLHNRVEQDRPLAVQAELRKWIAGDIRGDTADFQQWLEKRECHKIADGPYLFARISVTKPDADTHEAAVEDEDLLEMVKEEIVRRLPDSWRMTSVPERSGEELLWFSLPAAAIGTELEAERLLESVAQQSQAASDGRFKFLVTVALSDVVGGIEEVPDAKQQVDERWTYRFVYGPGVVIHSELLRHHATSSFTMQVKERDLTRCTTKACEAMRMNRQAQLDDALADWFDTARSCVPDMVRSALLLLALELFTVWQERPSYGKESESSGFIQWRNLKTELQQADDLEQARGVLAHWLEQIRPASEEEEERCRQAIVAAMQDLARVELANPDFGLAAVADALQLSTAYISRVYRQGTGISYLDYLHDVRLQRAMELLMNDSLTIAEVMEKVGYRTESHFFKRFKQKFGGTPKQCRTRQAIQALSDSDAL